VYGTARYVPIDEAHPLQAQSPYAASKIGADKLAESYHLSFGLPVVVLRPFNTYGPRQSARAVIPAILHQALAGRSPVVVGNLKPRRDLTYVADTVRAFQLVGTTPGIDGTTVHVGQGDSVSIAEVAELCLAVTGHRAPVIVDPERVRPDTSEVEVLHCNPARARDLLGWMPTVRLDAGLRATAEYLAEHRDGAAAERYVV
jgi:nucleoside-diphosphate-sugar epimerase